MKSLTVFILLSSCLSLVQSQELIIIDPWQLRAPNNPYQDYNASVGDTISFSWPSEENHTVYINPSRDCNDETGSILIGDTSPTNYTFTTDDATEDGNPLLFTDNIAQLCEWGMRFFVTVFPATTPAPVAPTEAPVAPVEPTEAPVAPTEAPVPVPTNPPTLRPTTAAPVVTTSAPTTVPPTTEAPTDTPTSSPTTPAPVTPAPTTPAPTTRAPVAIPTIPPIAPTDEPTIVTEEPTEAGQPTNPPVPPTNQPTMAPTTPGSISETLTGLQMGLAGMNAFPTSTQQSWEQLTKEFSESYAFSELSSSVTNFVTTYEVKTVRAAPTQGQGRRQRSMIRGSQENDEDSFPLRRSLQQQQPQAVIIEYTQTMRYDTTDPIITPQALAERPFATSDGKNAYVSLLRQSDDPVLEMVIGVSDVLVPPSTPTQAPTPATAGGGGGDDPVLSTAAIIGIACGGGAVLIMAVLYFMYCRGGGKTANGAGADDDYKSTNDPPLHVNVRDDEVSTLAGPTGPPTYGDQSVATVDYDYSKAYGGAGDTSVSSAGGTFGSNTQNQSALDPASARATGAALGALNTDDSFGPGFRESKSNSVKEEIIHIFAPPGKLGVVIDTPDDGAPVVHAVKDSSVIAEKIKVGDKLVAVDDEDVRSMTAIKVSKLISRKSANPSRKLTVIRTSLSE